MNEPDVAQVMAFPNNSAEKKAGLLKLQKEEDFINNSEVMRKGKGVLITAYRGRKREVHDMRSCDMSDQTEIC